MKGRAILAGLFLLMGLAYVLPAQSAASAEHRRSDCSHAASGEGSECHGASTSPRQIVIHAISTGDGVDGELIAGIELCAKETCRSARRISSNLPIEARPDGTALMIGQAQFDALTLSSVTVEVRDFRSGPSRRISIGLSDDGQVNKPHGDALILLEFFRDRACRENCLRIRRASLAYRLDDVRYLFYSPEKGVRANIDHGITLDIPARALDVSMIVYASSGYRYGSFPSLELFPGMIFKKPVSVIYDVEFFEGKWKLDFFDGRLSEDGRKFEIEINKSGRVHIPVRRKEVGVKSPNVRNIKEEFDLCLQLSRSHNRNLLPRDLFSKGWSAMDDCEHLYPYVHLFVVGGFVNWGIDVVYNSTEVGRGQKALLLTPLDEYKGYMVIINGDKWIGGKGILINDIGQAIGYVKGRDYKSGKAEVIGNGSVAAGSLSYCVDEMQGVRHWFGGWSRLCPQVVRDAGPYERRVFISGGKWGLAGAWGDYRGVIDHWDGADAVVSSLTYVVKDGVCVGGKTKERWSAFGVTPHGSKVFISSSDKPYATPSDLCRIFIEYGVLNAILLDGGSSTQLVVGGKLVNVMELSDRIAFLGRNSRPVAYGIGITGSLNPRKIGNYSLK